MITIWLWVAAFLSLGAADSLRVVSPPPSPGFNRPANALFADDFSRGGLRGWRTDSLASAWTVKDGVLRADLPDGKQMHSFLFAGDSTWTDYAVDFDVCGMRGVDKGVGVRVFKKHGLGVDLRSGEHQDVLLYATKFPVGSGKAENTNGSWHHVRVAILGNACRVTVDGRVVVDKHHLRFDPPPHGGIVLAAYAGGVGECTVYYDNVVVTPLAGELDP
jgi:Domain of Unknown Function (DUF1080)